MEIYKKWGDFSVEYIRRDSDNNYLQIHYLHLQIKFTKTHSDNGQKRYVIVSCEMNSLTLNKSLEKIIFCTLKLIFSF